MHSNADNARTQRRGNPIPEGLAGMNTGATLAAELADIEVTGVSGSDTVEVMVAAYRQATHQRAVFLQALLETGMRQARSAETVARCATPGEFAAEEARAALLWTRRRADATFAFAWDIFSRLPILGQAMLAGDLDEPRARVFVSWTTGLTSDQAATICANLLTRAQSMTTGELAAAVKRAAINIDPEWAERRYRDSIKQRRVVGSHNPDGTANITGHNMPLERAVAACAHVADIAKAAKAAGDSRPIDHIRADIYLGLLDGTFAAMDDHDIVDWMLHHPITATTSDETNDATESRDNTGNSTEPDDPNPGATGPDDPDGGHPGGGCDGPSRGTGPIGGNGPQHNAAHNTDSPGGAGTQGGSSHDGTHRRARDDRDPNARRTVTRRAVHELRLGLTSALGHTEHAGEIPGWGVVPAALARQMLPEMISAQWRYAVCDSNGQLLFAGTTRRRPQFAQARPAIGGIVELHITTDDLQRLANDTTISSGWAAVVADIHRAYTNQVSAEGHGADCDPGRRFANAALRRLVQTRDRTCVFPGCRMPATEADQDHRHDHALGGPTSETNLQSLCKHHHRLKGEGGWAVTSEPDDTITWRSPLGATYRTHPPPVMEVNPQWYRPPERQHRHGPNEPARNSQPPAAMLGDTEPPF